MYILSVILYIVPIWAFAVKNQLYPNNIAIVFCPDTGNVFEVFWSRKEVTITIQVNKHYTSQDSCLFCLSTGFLKAYLSRPLLRLMYGEYWFRLSRLSMMVIGSFASYTKTKSVESAVWCLLTLDDDVEQVASTTGTSSVLRDRNTWTEFRVRIVLFLLNHNQQNSNENEAKWIIEQRTK